MNLKSTSRFLMDGFLYILVFFLIIRRAKGEGNRAFDIEEILLDYYLPEIKDQDHPPVKDTATLNNYNEYPYQELLNFVKETKRILQSPNSADENRKKLLEKNFGTGYSAYLKGDNSDIMCPHPALNCPPVPAFDLVPPAPPIPLGPVPSYSVPYRPQKPNQVFYDYSVPLRPAYSPPATASHQPGGFGSYNRTVATPFAVDASRVVGGPSVTYAGKPEESACQQIVQTLRPHRLKSIDGREHFILNLGNEFVQEIQIIQCRVYRSQCGDSSTWPETYEKRCVQSYNSYKTLFSVPVNKTISILDQKLHIFEVSSGCHCSLKKQSSK